MFNPGTCNQGEQLIQDDDLVANENMDEVPLVVDEGPELVPEIGEEVEINAADQHEENVPAPVAPLTPPVNPTVEPRRTGRPKQYSARYQSYRKSLDRPLAKMGLLGMLLILAVLLLHS